jgi:hypothetical protein
VASSLIQVANLAGQRIGDQTRLTSLDENKNLARTLKEAWDIERRATLRDGSFNFSTTRGALAAGIDPSVTTYPYSGFFPLPTGALRLLELLDPIARGDYQMEGRNILCNVGGPLYARWITDIVEPAEWDDAFAEAFACRLAWKCGRKIAGSSFDTEAAAKEYQIAVNAASHVDAIENPPMDEEESDWVLARLGFGAG